jgi:hypothetical protein
VKQALAALQTSTSGMKGAECITEQASMVP